MVFFFQKKRPTDYNPSSLWIVTVQYWLKTNPANAHRPLRAKDFLNVEDIDNF